MLAADIGATIENASRLGSQAGLVLRALENRAALASLELEEARQRVAGLLLLTTVCALLALLAGFALTLLVAAVYWDTPHRVLALGLVGGVELVLAGVGAWFAHKRWKCWTPLLHTRDQLEKDAQCLQEILRPSP